MGKGGEKIQKSNAVVEKKEILIDGRYYDATNMKHPGGSIINFYANNDIDASQAFLNFHIRSKKAEKYLESLPSREADTVALNKNALPGQPELIKDFENFTNELITEGFFEPAPYHVVYRVAEVIVMHIVGYFLLTRYSILAGVIVLGIASGRCGWLMHEGGHYSLTGKISIDRTLQVLVYGLGCGMSASWWRNQHNKHHAMPQKIGHDVDLNTLPLVAFTEKIVKKIGFSMKLWLRMQAALFPILTTLLVALGWQFYLHPRHVVRVKNWFEMGVLTFRYVAWCLLFGPQFGYLPSFGIYLAYTWFGANYIFINFAVSHTHLDVVPKDDRKVDWVRYAAIYTMNVSPGPFKFISWWMSYLNFQVEHHLYPSMPQFRHPIISPRVKALFEKHGLKYDQRSYLEAMRVTFNNLDKVGMDVFYG